MWLGFEITTSWYNQKDIYVCWVLHDNGNPKYTPTSWWAGPVQGIMGKVCHFFSQSNKVSRVYFSIVYSAVFSILICLFMRQCVARLCSIDSFTFVYVY